jgi:virginiamycin B lyase
MRRLTAALVTTFALVLVLGAGGAAAATSSWKLGQSVHATAVTTGPGGNLWFGGYFWGTADHPQPQQVVGAVRSDGSVVEYRTGAGQGSFDGIVAGPDGALWLSSSANDEIVRATTDGRLSTYPLPAPEADPTTIVTGPDGALWFTEEGADALGRLTTGGTFSELPLPPGSKPSDLVVGGDGNLWVTAKGSDSIDRVALSGEITVFPIGGGADNGPTRLALGPDGNVWFVQSPSPRIGRITPEGRIAEFQLRRPAETVSAGPRGDVWFTYSFSDEFTASEGIASITPQGHPSYGTCPIECALESSALSSRPPGALWFASKVRFTEGGGASYQESEGEAGYIGSFKPRPPALRLAYRATARGGQAFVPVECRRGAAGERCHGTLGLHGRLHDGSGSYYVGRARVSLRVGERVVLRVPLSAGARRVLARRGKLVAVGSSTYSPFNTKDLAEVTIAAPRGN